MQLAQEAITTVFENQALTINDVDAYYSPDPVAPTSNTVEFSMTNDSKLNGWKIMPGAIPAKVSYEQLLFLCYLIVM